MMEKKLLSLAIVSMFFITGFSVVSAETFNQNVSLDYEPHTVSSDYEPLAHWEKPKAYFTLHNWSEEDLEITVDGVPVDNFTYFTNNAFGKFKNVNITFYQEEYLSLAWTYTFHPFITYKWRILYKVMWKIYPLLLQYILKGMDFSEVMEEAFNDAFFDVIENSPDILYYFKKGYTYRIHIGTLSGVNPFSLKESDGLLKYDMSKTIEFDGRNSVVIDLVN